MSHPSHPSPLPLSFGYNLTPLPPIPVQNVVRIYRWRPSFRLSENMHPFAYTHTHTHTHIHTHSHIFLPTERHSLLQNWFHCCEALAGIATFEMDPESGSTDPRWPAKTEHLQKVWNALYSGMVLNRKAVQLPTRLQIRKYSFHTHTHITWKHIQTHFFFCSVPGGRCESCHTAKPWPAFAQGLTFPFTCKIIITKRDRKRGRARWGENIGGCTGHGSVCLSRGE